MTEIIRSLELSEHMACTETWRPSLETLADRQKKLIVRLQKNDPSFSREYACKLLQKNIPFFSRDFESYAR